MSLDFTQQFQTKLDALAYSDKDNNVGWNFILIEDNIIKFQAFGSIDSTTYERLTISFDDLQEEYFKNAEFLVFLFDFTRFKKANAEVRSQIIEGRVFRDDRTSFVIYGMNYFVSTMAKVISRKLVRKRMFFVKDEKAGVETAKQLISNYRILKVKEFQRSNSYSQLENKINIKGKSYTIVSRQAWTYNDPGSDYSYKIDLIDDNILVARPTGYIRYQNSVMANVLFDKVVNSELKKETKYYRIQDYTSVSGSENQARRDFTDYILNGINRINLIVFYGLNRTMQVVVRLGKLVHPAFVKVRIAKTFEDALEMVIYDKYKDFKTENEETIKRIDTPKYKSPQEEIADLKATQASKEKENNQYLAILFDRISKIAFGSSEDYIPVNIDEENVFYDLFSAVQLLYDDYSELNNERKEIHQKIQKLIKEQAREIQTLKIENETKIKSKENFIRTSGHELNLSLDAILNAIQLLRQEDKPEIQKSLIEIIKMASITLQDGIGQLKSNIDSNHSLDLVSESMFNYRKNIIHLVEVARMGSHSGNIIFENKVEENLPTFLIGDKRKFNQLVNIYLENALKYTTDGFIKIYTHIVNLTATQVRLKLIVEDSGIGIDKYVKAQIFQDELIENGEAINGNKGFGLLIAKNLAHVLDADVGFESEKGVGSKFWVELTLNIGYHDKISQMHAVRDQRKGKKSLPFDGNRALLIIDDEIRRNLLEQVLRKNGINSRTKMNYEHFEDIEGKFDYVFVCLQLIGGIELKSIKMLINTIDAKNGFVKPIYIGSVDSTIDPIIEEYRKIGLDYFIQKSFKISDIDQFLDDIK